MYPVTALLSPAKKRAGATWIERWSPRPMATNSGMKVPRSPQLPNWFIDNKVFGRRDEGVCVCVSGREIYEILKALDRQASDVHRWAKRTGDLRQRQVREELSGARQEASRRSRRFKVSDAGGGGRRRSQDERVRHARRSFICDIIVVVVVVAALALVVKRRIRSCRRRGAMLFTRSDWSVQVRIPSRRRLGFGGLRQIAAQACQPLQHGGEWPIRGILHVKSCDLRRGTLWVSHE